MHRSYHCFSCLFSTSAYPAPSFTYKDLCDYTFRMIALPEKFLIKSAESLLPCKARHSRVLEVRNVFGGPLFCPSHYDLCSRKHIAKLAFGMPFWFGTVVCSVTSPPCLLIPAPPLLFLKPLWCLVHKLPAVPLSSQFLPGPHIPPLGWVSISSSRPTSKPSSPPQSGTPHRSDLHSGKSFPSLRCSACI